MTPKLGGHAVDPSPALGAQPLPAADSPASAHLDFKRTEHGWTVWCGRQWCPVYRETDGDFCGGCDTDISERLT